MGADAPICQRQVAGCVVRHIDTPQRFTQTIESGLFQGLKVSHNGAGQGMGASGINGFLNTRASLMLDIVFLAMFVVVPVLGYSIYLVKYRRQYALHKQIQIVLGAVLLLTVVLFELDMRINGWRERARPSPYFGSDEAQGWVFYALYIHLVFAVSTAALWIAVIARAIKHFPNPPRPSEHSRWHLRWGKLAAIDMALTALTGWIFYWLAFVAK